MRGERLECPVTALVPHYYRYFVDPTMNGRLLYVENSEIDFYNFKERNTIVFGKNDFTEVSKYLTRYRSESHFVGPSK